jgi:hypothetical protein
MATTWPGSLWRFSIDWPFAEVDDEGDPDYFAWTAPEALRCGDRLALYEGGRGNQSAFVAIGRAVTDSVRAHRGDHRHWAWVEWVPLGRPRRLAEVRPKVGYAHVAGSHARVDEVRFRLWAYLVRDGAAKTIAAAWRRSEQHPTTDQVPLHLLYDAKWRYRPQHEVAMYDPVREALVGQGCAYAPDDLSHLVRAMRGPTPTSTRSDHLREPDVWVLDRKHDTLMIV